MAELKALVESAFYRPPDPAELVGHALVDRINESKDERELVDDLLDLVEQHPSNEELCVDVLPQLTVSQLQGGIARNVERGRVVVEALRMGRFDWGSRSYRWADNVILALLAVASAATQEGDIELLEEAAEALFEWDGRWDQWPPQPLIRQWLAGLRGDAAGVVSEALIADPDSARHFEEVVANREADARIKDAIRRAAG
jgi:hypothetical protein